MAEQGVCEAFYEATSAIARHLGISPLPKGISAIETEKWDIAINVGLQPDVWDHDGSKFDMPPYSIAAMHKEFFVIATFDPSGGCIGGGMPEAQFIEEMREIGRRGQA